MNRHYYKILNFLILSAVIYSIVSIIYTLTSSHIAQVKIEVPAEQKIPKTEQYKKPSLQDFNLIIERNLFGSADKKLEKNIDDEFEDVEQTSLNLTLIGTVSGNQEDTRAVIKETGTRKQDIYKTGDSIQNAIIDRILRCQVIFKVGDKYEKLTMEKTVSSKESPFLKRKWKKNAQKLSKKIKKKKTTIPVKFEDIQEFFNDYKQILSQIEFQLHYKDGIADGLRIGRIKTGSIFSKLRIRNGDILQQINGKNLSSQEEIDELYENLQSGIQTSLQIKRRGRIIMFNYKVK